MINVVHFTMRLTVGSNSWPFASTTSRQVSLTISSRAVPVMLIWVEEPPPMGTKASVHPVIVKVSRAKPSSGIMVSLKHTKQLRRVNVEEENIHGGLNREVSHQKMKNNFNNLFLKDLIPK